MWLFAHLIVDLVWAGLVIGDGLHYRANGARKYFGTSMNGGVTGDQEMNAIATNTRDFGQYTCEYQMKWAFTEPQQNNFTYELSDPIVEQAEQYGMIMRCHNLVWHQSLPSWVTSTRWGNTTLLTIMLSHIKNVVSHFQGKCYAWDVVNEALYTDGTLRGSSNRTSEATSIWYTAIGPAYIPFAFAMAHATDPKAKLYYNDYNIESLSTQSPKINGVINIVNLIRAYHVPIHGIGLQAHLTASNLPSVRDLRSTLDIFTSMGLEVAYTELDVKSPKANPNRTGEALGYSNAVQACLRVPDCKGLTVWGFTERYSWLGSLVPPSEGDLFDISGSRTLSYYSALHKLPRWWG